jgi:hypothetical protein
VVPALLLVEATVRRGWSGKWQNEHHVLSPRQQVNSVRHPRVILTLVQQHVAIKVDQERRSTSFQRSYPTPQRHTAAVPRVPKPAAKVLTVERWFSSKRVIKLNDPIHPALAHESIRAGSQVSDAGSSAAIHATRVFRSHVDGKKTLGKRKSTSADQVTY